MIPFFSISPLSQKLSIRSNRADLLSQMLFGSGDQQVQTNDIVIPDRVQLGDAIDGKSVSAIVIETKISMPFTGNIEYRTRDRDVWIDKREPSGKKFANTFVKRSVSIFPNKFDVSEANFSEHSKDRSNIGKGIYSPGVHQFREQDLNPVEVVLKGFQIVGYDRDKGGMMLEKDMTAALQKWFKNTDITGQQSVMLLLT